MDDDPSILDTVQDILRSEGYLVERAENGREALEKFEKNSYNLTLLDIKLPDMTGTELLAKISKSQPEMVKIMITGYPTLNNATRSLYRGAHAYIIKPVRSEELLRIVEKKLEKQEKNERIYRDKAIKDVDNFLNLILDGKSWTINKIASDINTPQYWMEMIAQFYARHGLAKYWEDTGLVKISEGLKKLILLQQDSKKSVLNVSISIPK